MTPNRPGRPSPSGAVDAQQCLNEPLKRVGLGGFSGHKKEKGDKVVAFCDRQCNVIAPFMSAPGNRNESLLLREALPEVMRIVREMGMDLSGTIVSLDGVYDCRANGSVSACAIRPCSVAPGAGMGPRRGRLDG